MQEVYVNGEEFDKAEDVWEYLKEELGLEAGDVGGLYDALTELSDDTKITIDMSQVADDDLLDGRGSRRERLSGSCLHRIIETTEIPRKIV